MKLPFFKRLTAGSSAEVSDQAARNAGLLTEVDGAISALENERTELLLVATDDKVDANELKLSTARRNRERLLARGVALAVDLEAAKAREAANDLTARRAAVEARAEAARAWLHDTYPRLARELVAGFEEVKSATRATRYINDGLEATQRFSELLGPVETSFDPEATSYGPSIVAATVLVPVSAINAPGYDGSGWAVERL